MNTTSSKIKITFDEYNRTELTLSVNGGRELIQEVHDLQKLLADGKTLAVEVKQYRRKRSLDSNSYCWLLIGKIAKAMKPPVPEDDVYIEMLKRYGQREPKLLSVVADAVDMVYRATRNHCTEVGESELNGKLFKHLAILIGSSQYDTKSMSILIDGIVSEAKELDIEVLTPQQLSLIKNEWGK